MKKRTLIALTVMVVSCTMTGCVGTPVVYNCTCDPDSCNGTAAEDQAAVIAEETPAETPAETEKEEVTEQTTAEKTDEPAAEENVEDTEDASAESTALKTGLSLSVNVGDSTPADAENEGTVKYDVTVVAVSVDDAGVIESCIIDSVPASVAFDAEGNITSDLTAEILTKNELGEDYGMKAYGGAAYEWNEQAAALAAYAEGKTLDELKNGAIDETGMAKDADLASTATIYLGGYVSAIEEAVNQAQHLGAQKGDELRMASVSGVDSSVAVDGETDGTAQLDTTVTVMTMKEDVITSCYIDSVQAKVNFNGKGVITSDLTADILTKNELGEDYGMKAYAGSAYEWNEQAAAFAEYATGKTIEEVKGIAVDEKTVPTEADLASTVTIAVGGFQAVLEKAAK